MFELHRHGGHEAPASDTRATVANDTIRVAALSWGESSEMARPAAVR